jgi:uncharacterized protein YbjT (DUF2867 family)
MKICLTGATGYVGGRLAPHLLDAGHSLLCLVRDRRKLDSRTWRSRAGVEVVESTLEDADRLSSQLVGSEVAYYLIHSMEATGSAYAQRDRELATIFARAAKQAGVRRIIYLGGLGELGDNLSKHLSSRREVEECLESGGVPVTTLRAAMIIGSGSASFEILRYLVERLPVMITPRWLQTECQPIAVANVLTYLAACLTAPETIGQAIDIGGPEILNYRRLMDIMAEELGLRRRWIVPVPLLTPRLSSLWIHLVTPISYRIARPLGEGLRNRVVCRNDAAQKLMPQILLNVRQSIAAALGQLQKGELETKWSDAGVVPGDPDWAGGKKFVDRRSMDVSASPASLFAAICKVGGGHGYYSADWLWRLRGVMDRAVGGPGLRRGRRHPSHLSYGDALDFWRVTEINPPYYLKLHAEMKLPGQALLEFRVEPQPDGRSRLIQTARFRPRGLLGLAYWYAILPLHHIVFNGMLRGIAAEASAGNTLPPGVSGALM